MEKTRLIFEKQLAHAVLLVILLFLLSQASRLSGFREGLVALAKVDGEG